VTGPGPGVSPLLDGACRRVSAQVLVDEELYQQELDVLFPSSWNCVGHLSEIPVPGAYVVRRVGDESVLVSRTKEGAVAVLGNRCSHRGMAICTESGGERSIFECPYHGWSYSLAGDLVGVTAEKHMYEDFDKSSRGLPRYAVGVRWGFVFARPDVPGPTLDDYLGESAWYLDIMFGRTLSGLEVCGPPQRWEVPANWKLPAEQFSTDGYHALRLHKSMIDLGLIGKVKPDYRAASLYGIDIATSFGHAFRCIDLAHSTQKLIEATPDERAHFRLRPPPGMVPEMIDDLFTTLDDGQRSALLWNPPMMGQVFPNMAVMSMYLPTLRGEMGEVITARTWIPLGVDRTEIISWVLVETDAPEWMKERTFETTIRNFGIGGLFEEDDAEAWVRIHNAAGRGHGYLSYDSVLGERRPENFSGPGKIFAGPSRDDNQWEFWLEWARVLSGSLAPDVTAGTLR
jgi:phenylpropionate dioxygenase-like ring-hydroxylating dioxygenase large terminal subunit